MDYIFDELHRLATELLHLGEELNELCDSEAPAPESPQRIKEVLETLCKVLTRGHDFLNQKDSPLAEVARRVGVTRLSAGLDKVEDFIHDHRTALETLGVSPSFIDRVVEHLRPQVVRDAPNNLEEPQGFEAGQILNTLGEFRDLVCEVSRIAKAPLDMLKAVAEGAIGTAIIVVDITGAVTVAPHDLTGWTLLTLVKSVWSGTTMVHLAVGRLRELLGTFRRMSKLKETAPPHSILKKRPK